MKKIVLLMIVLGIGMSVGYAQSMMEVFPSCQNGYFVAGFVEKGENVYLITESNESRDTLNEVFVVNGRFEMSGELKVIVPVKIEVVLNGKMVGMANVDTFVGGMYFVYLSQDKSLTVVERDVVMAGLAGRFYCNEQQLMEQKEMLFQRYLIGTEEIKDSVCRVFREVVDQYEKNETSLVRENPNSYVSAAAVLNGVWLYGRRMRKFDYALGNRVSSTELELVGWREIEVRYASLSDQAKEWLRLRKVGERMIPIAREMEAQAKILATSVGQIAPDFMIEDPGGKSFTLYSVKAKLKLIDFWGSFCSPCRAENPHLLALYKEFNSKGFEVISVSLDSRKEDWLKAIATDGLNWRYNGWDRWGKASLIYGVTAVPVTILLGENHKIIGRYLSREQLRKKVEEYLKNVHD